MHWNSIQLLAIRLPCFFPAILEAKGDNEIIQEPLLITGEKKRHDLSFSRD
jgi:hypothetical protein